ncbi:MAG TPA: DUF4136 domain-containing protein [Thermoanaerobaculia bacterium]|nr:DUF4136 domain-containing protein [Thermoanaerobaculia bacterium]
MMTRRATLASLAACASLALAASAQAGTKIVNSWADANFGKMKFKNVLAIVATKDASLRRTAEDEICKNIVKTACTRGYTVLSEAESADKEKAIAKIKAGGFDAVILLRALGGDGGVTREAGAAMPQYYWTFDVYYGYWGGSWGVPYVAANTSYTKAQTYVTLETNIYDLSTDKLVWGGSTQTKNPDSARETVKDVTKTVRKDLKAKGLVD